MEIRRQTLEAIFAAINISELKEDDVEVLEQLKELCFSGPPEDEDISLCNLNLYKAASLWSGIDDVIDVLDNGPFSEYVQGLDNNQYEAFVAAIVDRVDWDGDAFCDYTAGNEAISDEIQAYIAIAESGVIPSKSRSYHYTEYAVEVQESETMNFLRQIDVFATYNEAYDYIEKHPECEDNECLNIIYIEYDEDGNEVMRLLMDYSAKMDETKK